MDYSLYRAFVLNSDARYILETSALRNIQKLPTAYFLFHSIVTVINIHIIATKMISNFSNTLITKNTGSSFCIT